MTLPPVKEAIKSLEISNVRYELFDRVRIEPTDTRYRNSKVMSVLRLQLKLTVSSLAVTNFFCIGDMKNVTYIQESVQFFMDLPILPNGKMPFMKHKICA